MKIKCTQQDLSSALSIVNRAVSSNNTLPVLNNIRITAENGELKLSATNLEIAINATLMAEVEREGTITVPAKSITAYVGLIKKEMLELELNGTELTIKSTGTNTKMKGIASDEFPLLPKIDSGLSLGLPAEAVRNSIDMVAFAASNNISRPVLTGIYWQLSGDSMKLAATDSYRLAEKTMLLEEPITDDINFILPAKTAQELSKILGMLGSETVEIQIGKGQIMFIANGVELTSRLIEGNFPDYAKILPAESKTKANLATDDFVLALKKMSVIVRDNNNNVKLSIGDGKVSVVSDETQVGHGNSDLSADTEGDTQVTALNASYILEVLSHLKDSHVHLGLNDGLSPVKVEPAQETGYVHIIMPLKV
ncbi:MAG: DNA polymerase-3 subunit beta [Oceanicoccus sp.]|jgi:DNA polymerase-3 subunit beta